MDCFASQTCEIKPAQKLQAVKILCINGERRKHIERGETFCSCCIAIGKERMNETFKFQRKEKREKQSLNEDFAERIE